jgi:hypothetical protein
LSDFFKQLKLLVHKSYFGYFQPAPTDRPVCLLGLAIFLKKRMIATLAKTGNQRGAYRAPPAVKHFVAALCNSTTNLPKLIHSRFQAFNISDQGIH